MMSIKSKILPFVPYGIVMKYHYRNLSDLESIEELIGQGRKYSGVCDTKRKIISIQGRGYSGSGAVVDLTREYDSNLVLGAYELENTPQKTQSEISKSPNLEFDIFRHSGGILELGYLLSIGNLYVNDAAIHRFIDFIDNWLIGLNGRTPISSDRFKDIVASFLDSLIQLRIPMGYATSFNPHLCKTHKKENYIYITKEISQQKYFEIAKKFIYQTFSLFETEKTLVFDQLLADRVYDNNTFDHYLSNYQIIQVLRDPRDVYATAIKYSVPWIPKSSKDFICWYTHSLNKLKENDKLMILRFENLVFDYDSTVREIEAFLGFQSSAHTRKFDFFDPNISKKNIGIYKSLDSFHNAIIGEIENELSKFCYN